MSLTLSTMMALGTVAPDFMLPDTVSGKQLSLQQLKSKQGTVVMFICNHCPYVQHILPKLIKVAERYQHQGVQFIAISANDSVTYPEDAPEKMRLMAERAHFPFPYLYDESQNTARAYHAACTPDFFLFDSHLHCVYRGRFDAATPGNQVPVTGEDLCQAMDNLLAGKPINSDQHPSMGCNIKWK